MKQLDIALELKVIKIIVFHKGMFFNIFYAI